MKNNLNLIKAVKREKRKNYIILYSATLFVWIILLFFSQSKGYFSGKEFVINLVNNLVGIIPPILIFDFFNEKLSRDASTIEISNQITEALMSNPESLELFTEEQRCNFVKSTIASIVRDPDSTEMICSNFNNYLSSNTNYRIKTEFYYNFELYNTLSPFYDTIFQCSEDYYCVQERLQFKVKYLSDCYNYTSSNIIKIGFTFNNTTLDSALREKNTNYFFKDCIFRENLDIHPLDIECFKKAASDVETFSKLLKLDLQIDKFRCELVDVIVSNIGIVCSFNARHDTSANEHNIRILFHIPKKWGTHIEVAIVDPTRAPKISLSYPEEKMEVDMYSFLSKSEETSLEIAHEHSNGIYDIAINSEWVYPISGLVFIVNKLQKF